MNVPKYSNFAKSTMSIGRTCDSFSPIWPCIENY